MRGSPQRDRENLVHHRETEVREKVLFTTEDTESTEKSFFDLNFAVIERPESRRKAKIIRI
jgi:alpha-mannosidase